MHAMRISRMRTRMSMGRRTLHLRHHVVPVIQLLKRARKINRIEDSGKMCLEPCHALIGDFMYACCDHDEFVACILETSCPSLGTFDGRDFVDVWGREEFGD